MTGTSGDRAYSNRCRKFEGLFFTRIVDEGRAFEGMAGVSRNQPRRSLLRELRNVVLLIALHFAIWSTVVDAHGQREHPFRREL